MKRALNIFAEVLALPYSELFMKDDPIRNGAVRSKICETMREQSDRIYMFQKELGNAYQYTTDYMNQHTEIANLTELQSFLHHVFNAKDILNCANKHRKLTKEQSVLHQYYFELLGTVSNMLLTTRNGVAMLRPWDTLPNSLLRLYEGANYTKSAESAAFSPQRIELWNSLLRCMPEDTLISGYVANQITANLPYLQQCIASYSILKTFGESVHIADVLLDKILEKGMAETHMHAGATRFFGMIWEDMLEQALHGKKVLEQDNYDLPFKESVILKNLQQDVYEAAVIRLLLARYLKSNSDNLERYLIQPPLLHRYQIHFLNSAREIFYQGHSQKGLSAILPPGSPLWEDMPDYKSLDAWEILQLPLALKQSNPTLAERCFQCWSMIHIKCFPEDVTFTALFLYYLRLRSKTYRYRVQDSRSTGLSYFQKYYSISSDAGSLSKEKRLQEIFYTAMRDKRIIKTEFRFSLPQVTGATLSEAIFKSEECIKKDILRFIELHIYTLILVYGHEMTYKDDLQAYHTRIWPVVEKAICEGKKHVLADLLDRFDASMHSISAHRFGIVYHLIKSGETAEKRTCFIRNNTASEHEQYKMFSFGNARFSYEASVEAISNLRSKCNALSRLIVGLDAAALEIPTEPWVFAPAFQAAKRRNAELSYAGQPSENKALLGATYHVGEDFRHPLSGLRHIDEAIDYLRMHPGDRIGHGLALGIDLDRWFDAHRLIVLPKIEWLENNLWIWKLIADKPELAALSGFASMIEKQILECACDIYGTLDGITPELLFRSYFAKTLPIKTIQNKARNLRRFCNGAVDCFNYLNEAVVFPCWNKGQKNSTLIWTEDMLTMSYHCSFYKHRMEETILLSSSPAQVDLSKRLQLYMRKKVAAAGLVVETNPSSNAAIGEIDGVLSHPAHSLRDGDGQHIMASINTDDPSVFNSTVANEHAQIYYTLRYHGQSVEAALKEVDAMREIGLRTSFIGQVPAMEQLLQEYEQIVRVLVK